MDGVIYHPVRTIGPTWIIYFNVEKFITNNFLAEEKIVNLFLTLFHKKDAHFP